MPRHKDLFYLRKLLGIYFQTKMQLRTLALIYFKHRILCLNVEPGLSVQITKTDKLIQERLRAAFCAFATVVVGQACHSRASLSHTMDTVSCKHRALDTKAVGKASVHWYNSILIIPNKGYELQLNSACQIHRSR